MRIKILTLVSLFTLSVAAQNATKQHVTKENAKLVRNGTKMDVDLTINIGNTKIKSTEALLITPAIVNGADTLRLPAIGLYSRQRWIQYERHGKKMSGEDEIALKKWDKKIDYKTSIDYFNWMNGAKLVVLSKIFGCRECGHDPQETEVAQYFGPVSFTPDMAYTCPVSKGVKIRKKSGSAWIQFPVDETVIYPERFNNPAELAKICASIDSVRNDKDITINHLSLKGFASPESPYKHNTELASGRVQAVRRYVQNLYHFPKDLITTSYEPEDWEGLRKKVENSALQNRDAILKLIDTKMDPDKKEARIKSLYPQDYKFMLDNWYPALRHTDYMIKYTIREYTDPAEARQKAKEKPQNLSIDEFYLAADGLDPNSTEFHEIWETAVRMFPSNPIANANAAAVALQKGDVEAAERYLEKAGNLPEAEFSRGVLATLKEDYNTAAEQFEKAEKAGVKEATNARVLLEEVKIYGIEK